MKHKKLFVIAAATLMSLTTGCSGFIPGGGSSDKYDVVFWGWGDGTEIDVFSDLVKTYNNTNPDGIKVKYEVKPSESYVTTMERTLNGNRGPDIFYVGDGDLKRWAAYDYLEDISGYVAQSEVIDMNDIWETAVERYRYNPQTKTSLPTDPLYCLPKDIGPTVIYYNKKAFEAVGVTFNNKPESECGPGEARGYNPETKVFNNRISMTIEEELELAKLLTKSINSSSITKYGFYTEWWFNYVWSAGGDCLGKDNDGHYIWTLGKTDANNIDGHVLPSNRELFKHFIDLSTVEVTIGDGTGYGRGTVMPKPNEVSSAEKVTKFISQQFAMLVGLRAHVPAFRQRIRNFDWDVAPLSHCEGGRLAGHSGSMGFGINKKSAVSRKEKAFKFMEYLAGPEGQTKTAESGFNLPNQISVANSEAFLQTDKKPNNSIIFVEAANYQTKGDWAYLPDKLWIDDWARDLNSKVLDGTMSIDEFFAKHQAPTDAKLRNY